MASALKASVTVRNAELDAVETAIGTSVVIAVDEDYFEVEESHF